MKSQFSQLSFDIVIIGSGAGGGTVAQALSSLCQKGVKIALLELGERYTPADNNANELSMAQQYYFNGGGFQTTSQDMTLAFAKGLGGSTNVYTGVTFKLPEKVLRKWGIKGLSFSDLEPRMEKYISENNASLADKSDINKNNQLFKNGCESLGWKCNQFPINTRNCQGLGKCNLGCPIGAKQGTAQVQIPFAEQNGVQVITGCEVERVDEGRVFAKIISPQSKLEMGHYLINTGKIVICAGAINTPAILLRSFSAKFNQNLGRYITCHPAIIMAGVHAKPVNGQQGAPKHFYSEQFAAKERFLLESCFYPPFAFARNIKGFGNEVDQLVNHYSHLQMVISLVMDEAKSNNRVVLDRLQQPQVNYALSLSIQRALVNSCRATAKLLFAAGAESVHVPAAEEFLIERKDRTKIDQLITSQHFKLGQAVITSAHLMGGCKMGVSKSDSVTNCWGRLHGKEGIYIADGSLFPGSAEVNPYLTIMALADRVAEGILKEY